MKAYVHCLKEMKYIYFQQIFSGIEKYSMPVGFPELIYNVAVEAKNIIVGKQ
jgi:hypothetical protein